MYIQALCVYTNIFIGVPNGNQILCVWEETTIIIVYIYVVAPLSASYNGDIPPAPYLIKL
jgi:hypothetical protein